MLVRCWVGVGSRSDLGWAESKSGRDWVEVEVELEVKVTVFYFSDYINTLDSSTLG